MPGKIVNKSELAAIFGKTPKTLTIWQNEGMPYTKSETHGTENAYDTSKCIEWLIRRETSSGLDLSEERAKQAREQTETARLKNEALRGDTIMVSDAIELAQRAAQAIRQKIIASELPEEDKAKLLVDIHSLGDADYRNFRKTDEPDEEEGSSESAPEAK